MPKKIMVVDDEPDIQDSIKMILEGLGYEVVTADDGEQCLEKLAKEKVDLIVLDFFMPAFSGRETAERINKQYPERDFKIIFLTVAEFGGGGMDEIDKLGIADYIQKPIDLADFTQRVKKVLGEA